MLVPGAAAPATEASRIVRHQLAAASLDFSLAGHRVVKPTAQAPHKGSFLSFLDEVSSSSSVLV